MDNLEKLKTGPESKRPLKYFELLYQNAGKCLHRPAKSW